MTTTQTALPAIGSPLQGGFFSGLFSLNGETFGLIVSPKAAGELTDTCWGDYPQDVAGARTYNDGLANTQAMTEAGSKLGAHMLGLDINGFTDWYLPSRDELELLYRHLKPTTETNYTWRHGDNPSSLPVGYPYTEQSPAQTTVQAFAEGGEEAFEDGWYWASTQFSPLTAWNQTFDGGNQTNDLKYDEFHARAVRRFKVTP